MSNKKQQQQQQQEEAEKSPSNNSVLVVEQHGKIEERWILSSESGSIEIQETKHGDTKAPHLLARFVGVLEDVLLPAGYPDSVSEEYLYYQLFDSLQCLCSSVVGTLSTRAILKGQGVGDATANAVSSTVNWLIRDGAGMLGRILFATIVASDLDYDAKRWRLAADITNDIGLLINIFSEHMSRDFFLPITIASSLFFAITQTAGGATRNALTQHFAQRQNVADVAAREGTQETVMNFIALFLGIFVVNIVPPTFTATLSVVLVLTFFHLLTNYLGVKCLILEHLNENRLVLCLEEFLDSKNNNKTKKKVPSPKEMRHLEGVVFPGKRLCSSIKLGTSLRDASETSSNNNKEKNFEENSKTLANALQALKSKKFAVFGDKDDFKVVLSQEASHMEVLESYLECIRRHKNEKIDTSEFLSALKQAGWKTDRLQLRVNEHRVQLGGGGKRKKEEESKKEK